MNSLQIRYFLTLAQHMSFATASNLLYVSQVAVSKQISSLEKELGVTLFHRGYRTLALTNAGRIMLEFFKNTQQSFEAAIAEAIRQNEIYNSQLNVGFIEGIDFGPLNSRILEFGRLHKDCNIRVFSGNISQTINGLFTGDFDLIFSFYGGIGHSSTSQLYPIMEKRCHIYLSKQHPLAFREGLTLQDFSEETFHIAMDENDFAAVNYYIALVLRTCGFKPRKLHFEQNLETVLMNIKLLNGVSLMHENARISAEDDVIGIPTDTKEHVCAIWDRKNNKSYLAMLLEHLEIPCNGPARRQGSEKEPLALHKA